MKAVKVDHPGSAHGFVVCNHNFKITYSGDTMPCENLITAGKSLFPFIFLIFPYLHLKSFYTSKASVHRMLCRHFNYVLGEDSTLLIHEATLNDDMPEEALARKHR